MVKKKHLWIVNFHATPPEYSFNPRYLELIPHLQSAGYDITVISTAYLRKFKKFLTQDKEKYSIKEYGGLKFIHIKPISYTGNGFRRMLAMLIFSFRLLRHCKKFEQPDIIYHNLHVPFDVPVYFVAKRLKAQYIAEIWDLWPEFFHRMGLVDKRNPLVWVSYHIERWVYSKAEKIIYTMPGWPDYVKNKGWDKKVDIAKSLHITNGIDINKFNEDTLNYQIEDEDLSDNNYFKVLYVGSLRKANNVMDLIKAAKALKEYTDIKFIIYGDGEDRLNLEEYVKNNNLKNVIFKQKQQPFHNIPFILSKASLNIMNYQKGFGDFGISTGKFPLYLASGKPIVSNVKVKYCLITKNNLGISDNFSSPEEYANAILKIKNLDPNSYEQMCERAKTVSKDFDYSALSDSLIKFLNQ